MPKQTIAETGRDLTPVEIKGTAEARDEWRRAESLERMVTTRLAAMQAQSKPPWV